MELIWLDAFVAVAQSRSFKSAAQSLGVSRGTLRGRVTALESCLDVALFVRGHGGVELTPAGREFLPEADDLQRAARRLARFGERLSAGPKPLEVLLPAGLPTAVEVILAQQFRSLAPGLELVVQHHPEPATGSSANTDLIVHFGKMPDRGAFRTLGLMHLTLVPQASQGYLAANGRPESLEALLQHPLLSWTHTSGDGRVWPLVGGGGLEVAPSIVSDSLNLIQQLALDGVGIALVPDEDRALAFEPELSNLSPVLPDRVRAEVEVRILLPEHRADTPHVRTLLALLRSVFGS